jgi:hypothetical protein
MLIGTSESVMKIQSGLHLMRNGLHYLRKVLIQHKHETEVELQSFQSSLVFI